MTNIWIAILVTLGAGGMGGVLNGRQRQPPTRLTIGFGVLVA